jgi:hypothetical protein
MIEFITEADPTTHQNQPIERFFPPLVNWSNTYFAKMMHYQLFDCGMYMLRKIRWFDLHLKDDIELNFIKKIEKLQNHTHKSLIHTNCALLHILEKSKDVRTI